MSEVLELFDEAHLAHRREAVGATVALLDDLLARNRQVRDVRIKPGVGALVTNCGIDRSRARGLSRWGSHTMLNVSAGLGTSPYLPMRFCCRPEASLITLRPRVA